MTSEMTSQITNQIHSPKKLTDPKGLIEPLTTEQFLTFSLGQDEQQALLATSQLLEIVRVNLSQITPIAGIAPYVMGVYNWRGDVIWVIDLASMLGYKPLYAQEQSKFQDKCNVIFLRTQDMVIGLAVSQVGQMIKCDISKIQTTGLTFTNPVMHQACRGYWLTANSDTFLVLDGNAIAQATQ
jgi:positive phototaxis protein PixI